MKGTQDSVLIERSIAGDTRAFGVLVERYQDYIFTVVYRMLKVREEAEEVAQDSFLKAYAALPSFRGDSKFSTWLYRIAYRKALDKIRMNKRGFSSLEITDNTLGMAFEELENGLEFMLREERNELVKRVILELPEQEAAIITLFYFEEQSIKEIAVITGLSEDNVKVKLYRSRKILFALLENYMLSSISEKNGKAI